LIGLEQDLRKIATKQGKNVNELVDLVAENESILNKMKGNLKQTFVASMAKVSKLQRGRLKIKFCVDVIHSYCPT